MKPQLIDAILSLVPNAEVALTGNHVTWIKPLTSPVSDEEIVEELARLLSEYQRKDYIRKRVNEYPPITDYIDGVVKGDQAQVDRYVAECLLIKAKHPKPV